MIFKFEIIIFFDDNNYTGKITIDEAEINQSIFQKIRQNVIINQTKNKGDREKYF